MSDGLVIPDGAVLTFDGDIFDRINSRWVRRAEPCSGIAASWCPNHGTCACPDPTGERDSGACPLHSPSSSHGD